MNNNALTPLYLVAIRLQVPYLWLLAEVQAGRVPALQADHEYFCDLQAVEAALLARARKGEVRNGR